MRVGELVPIQPCSDTNEFLIGMICKMARKIDHLETRNSVYAQTISDQMEFIEAIKSRANMEHGDYIILDTVFKTDADFRMIKDFLTEEE